MKYQITLKVYEMECLLKAVHYAYKKCILSWDLNDTILEQTKIIYEPEEEGA